MNLLVKILKKTTQNNSIWRKSMKNNYMESINKDLKEYFNMLEPDFPSWLNDYINTKEMLKKC